MIHFVENIVEPAGDIEPIPLICIHGAACDHRVWPSGLLHHRYRKIYMVDLPGHGRSQDPIQISIESYFRSIVSFLDNKGIERAVVCGHSMGGAIALDLTIHCRDRVGGLILVSSGSRLPVSSQILSLASRVDFHSMVLDWTLKMAFSKGTPDSILQRARDMMMGQPSKMFYEDLSACSRFDLSHRTKSITVPTLVICGTKDKMTPLDLSQDLNRQIASSELKVLNGAGHFLPMEMEVIFTETLLEWLKQIEMTPH